jgi:xylulokinase
MSEVPVAAGGGDNAAGAVGSGVIGDGDGFLSLGTSGVVFVADNKFRPNPDGAVHTFCHALPDLWHEMSVMLSAASAVDWVAQVTGFASPADLYAAAEIRNQPAATEIFLPYLSGERTPHNDPYAKGMFFGLSSSTDRTALAQAALEGVGFALADGIDAILEAGASINSLSVIGGGARSRYWGGVLASILDRPLIYRREGTVGPAYGAARLARLALTGEDVGDVCTPPPVETVIEPDIQRAKRYRERRGVFRSLYSNTKDLHQET